MTANTLPIYTLTPDVSSNNSTSFGATLTTATGDYTGVSGNYVLVHTAGTNGSYIRRIRMKAIGSNTASVARIFLNNGSTPGSAANNMFIGEISLPGTTGTNSASTPDIDYPIEIAIPAGFRLYVGLGTTVAAGWTCVAFTGQY